jgi:hypothetical protein
MHCLIKCILIAFCGMTCAEICQDSTRKAEMHDILDGEPPVVQHKCTLEGVLVVNTVAGHMENVGWGIFEKQTHVGE